MFQLIILCASFAHKLDCKNPALLTGFAYGVMKVQEELTFYFLSGHLVTRGYCISISTCARPEFFDDCNKKV